ncbi:acetylxylan esterase [Rosistilla oblonga]|uniref:acetylxylan esterase n=1 Tax=Rosistilla oblonga TaxID=2527990 RepID=UPI003A96EB8D
MRRFSALRSHAMLLAFALPIFLSTASLAAAEGYALSVAADRDDAIYDSGEAAAFVISVTRGDQPVTDGKLTYVVDDFLRSGKSGGYPEGEASLDGKPVRVAVKSDKPNVLRCQVTYTPAEGKPIRRLAGLAFSPTEIEPSMPVPDDFDAFWADQKKQLAEVEITPTLTPVEQKNNKIACFDVQVPCLGGAPVSGYFAKPVGAEEKSLPAILWVHGAGVRSSSLYAATKGANAGMLSMDINAHGIPNGKPAEFYAQQSGGPLKNYRYAGRDSRETIYFRGMFLRLVRAIDFLTMQPEWNGREVIVIGHSQGGGQALVAGGLDPRVTLIASGVPAICDHTGNVADRVNGWPKLVPNGPDGKPEPAALEASRYVDSVNFASRCKADAIMSVGFVDVTCPPTSCYAAYNALLGEKTMISEPLMGHNAPKHIHKAFFDRVLQHVEQSQPAAAK